MKKEVVKDQELDLSVLTKNQSSDEVVNSLKQQHLEMKIVELQQLIMSARVLDESKMDTSKALLLSTVKIKNLKMFVKI